MAESFVEGRTFTVEEIQRQADAPRPAPVANASLTPPPANNARGLANNFPEVPAPLKNGKNPPVTPALLPPPAVAANVSLESPPAINAQRLVYNFPEMSVSLENARNPLAAPAKLNSSELAVDHALDKLIDPLEWEESVAELVENATQVIPARTMPAPFSLESDLRPQALDKATFPYPLAPAENGIPLKPASPSSLDTAIEKASAPPQRTTHSALFQPSDLEIEHYISAARIIDRENLTKAGRSLDKHGARPESVFPKVNGPFDIRNSVAEGIVRSILTDPASSIIYKKHKSLGNIIEIRDGAGKGIRYANGPQLELIGFLEPGKKTEGVKDEGEK